MSRLKKIAPPPAQAQAPLAAAVVQFGTQPEATVVVQFNNLPDDALLRRKQLVPNRKHPERAALLQINVSTLDRWVAKGTFPKPLRIGGVSCWRVRDVRAWLNAQTVAA